MSQGSGGGFAGQEVTRGPGTDPFGQALSGDRVHLRILATSDLHMHVAAYDYYADRPSPGVGLSRTASLIAAARAEAANCLLFDNGDLLQGNPLGDHLATQTPVGMHPMFRAMQGLGYDAGTLGNHEFDQGLDVLLHALRDAPFPLVVANLALRLGVTPAQDETLLPPWVILDRRVTDGAGGTHPLRVGVIGFAPPQVTDWNRHHLAGRLFARDILEAARAHLPALRAAGADVVVALSHSGIGSSTASDGMENASTLIAILPGIDAVITGHAHLVFPGPDIVACGQVDPVRGRIGSTPVVMPGFYGSHLGVIDLALERVAGVWHVRDSRTEARPIAARAADGAMTSLVPDTSAVLEAIRAAHDAALRWTRRTIGHSAQALHSYFALVSDSPAVRLVTDAQRAHVAAALAGTALADLPLLSAAAPFKAGGRGGPLNYTDVPPGPIALRHAADLYIHLNTIAVLGLSGAEIAEWLERAASIFRQIAPGAQDAPLIDPEFASFNFDMIAGLGYRIDLSAPPRYDAKGCLVNPGARRIYDLKRKGAPLDHDARVLLVTNSYRISGTSGFAGADPSRLVHATPDPIRDIVIRHMASSTVTPLRAEPEQAAPSWSFLPMPGTTVLFHTGQGARGHLSDIAAFAPEDLGITATGFLTLRLHL